jgi:hypothetical protein
VGLFFSQKGEKYIMPTVKKVFIAFKISPSNAYQLQCQGKLPERPPGTVTPEFIEALAAHIKGVRGSIPPDAQAILKEISER